jgi:hypothetical protein
MTTTTQKMFQDKRTALQRLDGIEELLIPLLKQMKVMSNKLDGIAQVVNGIVVAVGKDVVTQKIVELQLEDERARAEETKRLTEDMKQHGVLTPAEVVTKDTVIVATESKPDGTVHGAGWFRVQYNELSAEAKALFEGKKAGERGTFDNGNTFEILEVLQMHPEKLPEYKKNSVLLNANTEAA